MIEIKIINNSFDNVDYGIERTSTVGNTDTAQLFGKPVRGKCI